MAKIDSGQKHVGRNRPPRVQIEYDSDYGSRPKVELPFVVGVMSELSGKLQTDGEGKPIPLPDIADRELLEIDIDNFDDRLKSMKPRVVFDVENKLTGTGNLKVDITFTSLDDFSPAAIASKVKGLDKLLAARQQLANLLTYMDGKSGAEALIAQTIDNRDLLRSLIASVPPVAALDSAPQTGEE